MWLHSFVEVAAWLQNISPNSNPQPVAVGLVEKKIGCVLQKELQRFWPSLIPLSSLRPPPIRTLDSALQEGCIFCVRVNRAAER